MRTRLIVVVGGSGVGKSTLIDAAIDSLPGSFAFLVDTTTRQRRATEAAGPVADKRFVSPQEFADMVYDHHFVSWSRNAINGEYYGTEFRVLWDALVGGRILVTTVDGLNATRTLKALQGVAARLLLRPVVVWVRPPSLDALEKRLRGAARGAAADSELRSRLEANRLGHEACVALEAQGRFDVVIANDELETASRQFGELCRSLSLRRLWPWLSLLAPLRLPVTALSGQLINLAKWIAAGAEHCDRPRLRRHATEEGGTRFCAAPPRLRGLARSLELVPVAGGRPAVAKWVVVACLPHTLWCLVHAHPPLRCPPAHAPLCAALGDALGDALGGAGLPWRLLCAQLLAVAAATAVASARHDPALSRAPPFRRFKTSFSHFALRWLGPVPLLVVMVGGGGPTTGWLLGLLLAMQGLALAAHWLVKGLFKRAWPAADPSGHARVCLNTVVYAAWLGGAAEALGLRFAHAAAAAAWVAMQIATVFVSRLTHHTLLDMALGYACTAPQLVLLHVVFSSS